MTEDEKKRIFEELKRKAESDEDIILGCGRFEEALSSSDREGMKAALEMLSIKAQYEDYLEGDRKIITHYSKLVGTAGGIRSGRREVNYPGCLLNPYYGSAEEMYALAVLNSDGSSLPITSFVAGVAAFLGDLGEYSPSLREAAYPYLNTWMKDLIEVTGENISSLMNDRNEDYDPDGPGALSLLLEALIADGHFRGVISYAFSILGENIARAEKYDLRPSSPLNTAVRTGDMETFESFYASGIIRDIVHRKREEGLEYTEEVPGINRGKIMVYPERSSEMLERIFSLGILLPGSEDGREAFDDAVTNGSPSREILTRIRHPSYFTTGSGRPLSPLVKAVRNPSFSPENYDLLVASPWGILLSRGGSSALEKGEFIVKMGDGCFLTKPLEEEYNSSVHEAESEDVKQKEGEEGND